MSPEDQDRLSHTRFAILSAARASGVVLMLFGMWIWFGDLLDRGGNTLVGLPLFGLGFAESLILPKYLARQWRTPPGP